jgi:hypothetical protein
VPLNPEDERHAAQIAAGVTGRKRGHDFEKTLAVRMNLLQHPFSPLEISNHLFVGSPEVWLLSYICQRSNLEPPFDVKAFSTGGHATGEGGDAVWLEGGGLLRRAKSDLLLQITKADLKVLYGVSVKTCSKSNPTNAQLYCSTADAFCNLLISIGIEVSHAARIALKMFCGDIGFRPMDLPVSSTTKRANPERWFWEELPGDAQIEWASLLTAHQREITHMLLSKGYKDDPFPSSFVLHQTRKFESWEKAEVAIFTVDELVEFSCSAGGFSTKPYSVRKGRFKDASVIHQAPRFGFVQLQQFGNKQNATQLQFNLQAGYFYKLKM